MNGRLILVVGPSGAGKDSLIAAAQKHFSDDPKVIFPQRYITRPSDAGGEDHMAVSTTEFEQLRTSGGFALHWGAHNLKYGVPSQINHEIENGNTVIVNVSRSIIDFAQENYTDVSILSISVTQAELAKRLSARGRESSDEIIKRLARAEAFHITGPNVIEIDNSGDIRSSSLAFINAVSTT